MRIVGNPSGAIQLGDAIDSATKSLIDDLIVPIWVEEFLRLHGPKPKAGEQPRQDESQQPQPSSELD